MYVHMYVSMYVYVCIYVCICVYVSMYVHVCMYVYVCIYVCIYCINMCICIYVCTCMYLYMYMNKLFLTEQWKGISTGRGGRVSRRRGDYSRPQKQSYKSKIYKGTKRRSDTRQFVH